ncbi:hypothetical protein ACFL7M_17170 [Thermodesulfobacteriota bacterium]
MEVKAGINPRSKSLKSYDQQFSPEKLVRTNLLNLKKDGKTCNIPYMPSAYYHHYWDMIKLTSTPSIHHLKPLNCFRNLAGNEAADKGILVCNVDKKMNLPGKSVAIPWFLFSDWLTEMIKKGSKPAQ